MAVQIVSDLHLEAPKAYDVFEIVPRAPVLALLGDIGNVEPHMVDLAAFLERQLRQFHAVLFVPGNHEAYHSTWPRTLAILRSFEETVRARRAAGDAALGELVVLDRGAYRLPGPSGTVVLGCPLFSYVPPERATAVSMGLNDFRQIGDGWDVAAHNRAHARDVAWLNETVMALHGHWSSEVRTILIVTHWCPSLDAQARDPRHGTGDALASAFATDLSSEACFRAPKVKAWAFGHTHYNCDFVVERDGGAVPLRLVTNQKGYDFAQAAGYDNDKSLWVDV
ncbi:hypothetical protein SPI_04820 [Niveomyces insectorum RCEF 264]|uniref:Calcineurin-like phosphoesterase domain-containing protein n=1 Tax=Niveomyces insectorum RCEF 264 TaxID=1081102 RepID=A0A167UVY7_9HYPO|nr:hypothetical protein SPI_04820 [Niveomyces insectorum RCEF 264]